MRIEPFIKGNLLKFVSLGALAIMCAGGVIIWHATVSKERFQDNITKIHEGMAKTDVIQISGQPDETKKPCNPSGHGCNEDLVYHAPLDLASYWAISLDVSGHVIEKFHWQSP